MNREIILTDDEMDCADSISMDIWCKLTNIVSLMRIYDDKYLKGGTTVFDEDLKYEYEMNIEDISNLFSVIFTEVYDVKDLFEILNGCKNDTYIRQQQIKVDELKTVSNFFKNQQNKANKGQIKDKQPATGKAV